MNFSVWIKMLALSLMIAGTAYGDPDSKKQIDFEGDVVEGVNKQPLDSLNQISNGDNGSNRLHLYRRKRPNDALTRESRETLRELVETY